ncbi:MAG: DUF2892 domain-containing protein [Pedosphaera sp.]|nr:DUF2892 domain-containing protein [Pedosphaera sp.]
MKKFFARNIEGRGRWIRAIGGGLFVLVGVLAGGRNVWAAVALILAGGFLLFEAVRGWCVLRACGFKTKL